MNAQSEKLLDRIGRKILAVLQDDARQSLTRIGQVVGLSAPAVAERIKKLEEAGILLGYHASVDPAAVGRTVGAFIELSTETRHYPAVQRLAADSPEIIACHHISGGASFLIHVRVTDVAALESLVTRLSPYGQTRSSIVLSTPVDKRDRIPL